MAYSIESADASNRTYANELKSAAFSALSQLESAALGIAFSEAKYNKVDLSDFDRLEQIDITSLPTISEVFGNLDSITPDPFPDPLERDEVQKYKRHVWEDTHLDNIQTALTAYMDTMGMPSTAFQDSIFDADKERKSRALVDAIALISAETSARGFKYANIQTAAGINDLMQKHQFDLENQTREITKLVTDWARTNYQFSIQQGLDVEKMHMDFAYKYSSIFREIYMTQLTAILDKYRAQMEMEIAKLNGKVKLVLARADVLKSNADISATDAKILSDRDRLEIEQSKIAYDGAITDLSNRGRLQVDAASHRATVSGNLVSAVNSSILGVSISKQTT